VAKIKLTKGELKRQRDALGQFKRYLPTLQLKKQQLQMKIFEAQRSLSQQQEELKQKKDLIARWVGLLADPSLKQGPQGAGPVCDLQKAVLPLDIMLGQANVAGAYVPVFNKIMCPAVERDPFLAPLWLDRGIEQLKAYVECLVRVQVIEEEIRCLGIELRTTTQRVNLFEKVKIPECQENIRKITIYLGDQQANAVGISKVAKKKIELATVGR
jgi:V/A-type H+-transporting ATPase subunit D